MGLQAHKASRVRLVLRACQDLPVNQAHAVRLAWTESLENRGRLGRCCMCSMRSEVIWGSARASPRLDLLASLSGSTRASSSCSMRGTEASRDLLVSGPVTVLIEAKIAHSGPLFAIRDAVGQLLEYRHFLGPKDSKLCILLDRNPGERLVGYVEHEL